MKLGDIRNISVIGAGTMGSGIGLTFALCGYEVTLNDVSEKILNTAMNHVEDYLGTFNDNGIVSKDDIEKTISRIRITTSLEKAAEEADFVTETASEDLEVKRKLFTDLDAICPQHTIIASNTSSLALADFAERCKRRDKILITHWINPPHIIPAVEILGSKDTSNETIVLVCKLMEKVDKVPIRVLKELQGLIINRIQAAMIREVFSLWEEGVATPVDIDKAVKASFGLRLAVTGPLETCDFGGLDIWYTLSKNLFKIISDIHKPPERIKMMVERGELGLKSGKGFFDYDTSQNRDTVKAIKERDTRLIRLSKLLFGKG